MVRPAFLAACIGCATWLAPSAASADAKAECVAAADQGQSLRDDGKYRRARDAFATCARDVCPKVVVQSCTQWMHDLEAAMPTVVLGAKDDRGNDVAAAHVTVDGQPLTDVLDGKPVAVDPGVHALRFERRGSQPAEADVIIRAGEKNRDITVALHDVAASGGAGAAAVATQPPAPASESTAGSSPFFTARNTTALVLVVAGVAAVAGGAYFVSQSSSESNTASSLRSQLGADDACTANPSDPRCASLKSAVDAQHTDATVGALMLAAGGAAVVGGVVAWLVWPKSSSEAPVAPELGAGRITLRVSGSF